jgi:hypothetical protein
MPPDMGHDMTLGDADAHHEKAGDVEEMFDTGETLGDGQHHNADETLNSDTSPEDQTLNGDTPPDETTAGATGATSSHQLSRQFGKKKKAVVGRACTDHIEWAIFVPDGDDGVIRPFATLPSRTQEQIRNTIYAKYCYNDDKKWKRAEAIKHDMTALMVRKDKRHSYVEEGRCMNNVVVGRAKNKMSFQGSKKIACDTCTHVKKPCARMVLDGGQVKLCIYPVATSVRDGLELGDVAFWC